MDAATKLLARELIRVKHQIQELLAREQEFKTALLPLIREHGTAAFEEGKVYYGESRGSRSFRRTEVLDFIRENFGSEVADLVDQECTAEGPPRQTVFVKLIDQKETGHLRKAA